MSLNAFDLKEKILFFIKTNGPSLPVHIAKYVESSVLFTSAFLSELFSEKMIKISNMKVGNSPLYFISGQEHLLERFCLHLKSKEKDAFSVLKEKKFLKDSEQLPAIRVALRAIKDFAIPFKKNDEIFWRYHTVPEAEFTAPAVKIEEKKPKESEIKIYQPLETKPIEIKLLEIEQKKLEETEEIKPKIRVAKKEPKKIKKIRKLQKKDDNFFNKIKEWASTNSMEIINIEGFSKNELQLKVKNNEEEHLLVAYNKKRLADSDLVKANKKARDLNLKYTILSFGEPIRKMNDLIDAARNLSEIKKIE